MNNSNSSFITAFCVFLILLTYVFIAWNKSIPSGDETISYLSATGNQQSYESVSHKEGQYGVLLPPDSWRAFFERRNGHESFLRIAPGLERSDLHPPLYFWLLYCFTFLPLPLYATGLVLNCLLHICGLFLLVRLCRQLSLPQFSTVIVMLLWCLSPATVGTGFFARQYELTGIIGLFASTTFIAYDQTGKRKYLFLFITALLCGMLTHYLFIYFSFAYAGYMLIIRKKTRETIAILAVILISFGFTLLIHPGLVDQFILQQQRAQAADLAFLPLRLVKILLAFVQVFLPVWSLKGLFLSLPSSLAGVFLSLSALVMLILLFRNRKSLPYLRIWLTNPGFSEWMLFCSLAIVIIPYLFFLTPMHAMGGQYMVLAYPFLLIIISGMITRRLKLLSAVMSITCVGYLLQLLIFYRQQQAYKPLLLRLKQADIIVVNSTDRRGFLRLVPYLDQHQMVMMDENASPCKYTGKQVLMITDDPGFKRALPYMKGHETYPLYDGITFYTNFIGPASCGQLP